MALTREWVKSYLTDLGKDRPEDGSAFRENMNNIRALCRFWLAHQWQQDALDQIVAWAQAYPIAVFPEPDWKRVAKVLKDAGLSLDCVSASNMRHVITRVQEIIRSRSPATNPEEST